MAKRNESMLTVAEAAVKVGVSAAGVRNWIKQEPELSRAIVKQSGVTLFSPAAVKTLERVKDRRMKGANPALRKAWEMRRAGKATAKVSKAAPKAPKAAPKAAAAKSGKRPLNPGLEKAWAARRRNAALRREEKAREATAAGKAAPAAKATRGKRGDGRSAAEAAKDLGISKVRLYQIIKRFGIKKPGGSRAFTDPVMANLRDALAKARAAAGKAATSAGAKATKIKDAAVAATPAPVRQAAARISEATESALHETLRVIRELLAQNKALLERAVKPFRIRLEQED